MSGSGYIAENICRLNAIVDFANTKDAVLLVSFNLTPLNAQDICQIISDSTKSKLTYSSSHIFRVNALKNAYEGRHIIATPGDTMVGALRLLTSDRSEIDPPKYNDLSNITHILEISEFYDDTMTYKTLYAAASRIENLSEFAENHKFNSLLGKMAIEQGFSLPQVLDRNLEEMSVRSETSISGYKISAMMLRFLKSLL